MPVSFTTQGGKDPVQSIRDLIRDTLPKPEQMEASARQQIARILKRTASGVDVNGQAFAAYSPNYAKIRQKKGLRVSPPDLRVNGRLLDAMRVEVLNDHQFAIELENSEAGVIAAALNDGSGRMPARHFFATSQDELKQMLRELRGVE
jgi:ribosomal protein L16/L10AE